MTMEILAGLAFGFVGSLHCVGMCGPLVLALPLGGASRARLAAGRTLYHLGRVITYALIGAAVGTFGGKLLLPLLQQRLSVVAGATVLLAAVAPALVRKAGEAKLLGALTARVSGWMGRLLREKSLPTMLGLGMLNGLLPCGFVYVALAAALVTGSTLGGTLFMAGFGLGTVPAMLSVSLFPGIFPAPARARLARVLPAFSVAVGVLLIVRGLNLGIPYVSPKFAAPVVEQAAPDCCGGAEEGARH